MPTSNSPCGWNNRQHGRRPKFKTRFSSWWQIIVRKFAAEWMARRFFAILVNETADISRTEQMCLTLRTCNETLEAEEVVFGLYSLPRCDSETITSAIPDVLLRLSISIQDSPGQRYDGAPAMSAQLTGLTARIVQLQSKAIYTHCQMHSLNLATLDSKLPKFSPVGARSVNILPRFSKELWNSEENCRWNSVFLQQHSTLVPDKIYDKVSSHWCH